MQVKWLLYCLLLLISCGTEVGNPGDGEKPNESNETPIEDSVIPSRGQSKATSGDESGLCAEIVLQSKEIETEPSVLLFDAPRERLTLELENPDGVLLSYAESGVELFVGTWSLIFKEDDIVLCSISAFIDQEDLKKSWIVVYE